VAHIRKLLTSLRINAQPDALAALKARGALLGSARPGHWDGREQRRAEGLKRARQAAIAWIVGSRNSIAFRAASRLANLQADGLSYRAIAARLNSDGLTTRTGKPWSGMAVVRASRLR
jgi:hypothetical protein